MSLIGNPDTPSTYVADYMQACVGMFGIPAGGFTDTLEAYGAATDWNVESLYAAMLNSSIGRSIFAPGVSNTTFATTLVGKLGGSLLADATEAAAIDVLKSLLDGGMSQAAVAMAAVEYVAALDTTDADFGAVAQQFQNRVVIANYYTFSSNTPSSTLSTLTAVLSGVSNSTNVDNPGAYLDTITTPGATTGQTYTLTTGVDNIVGTTGSDTLIADNTGGTKQLSVADQIDGGAGTDTLKVYLATGDTGTGQPSFSNIEKVYINGGAVVAYTAATGTTDLLIDAPVALTNATYTLSGQNISLANEALTASAATAMVTTIAAGASSTHTSQNVTLNNWTSSGTDTHTLDLSGTKVTTLNLTTTGAASKITSLTNTGAAMNKITVAGDKALTVTESLAAVKTIDASASTGGVTFDVSGATMNIAFAFTGGSGNDKLTMAAGNLAASTGLTSGAQLDFGAGTDTLVIKDTTPVYATINAMKNLEQVEMGVTAGTFDMSQLTPTAVRFGAVAAGTVSNLEATDSVTATGAMGTSLTVGGAVGNSNGTIHIGTSTSAGFTIASLVTTGLTNIALSSNGTNAAANVITAMTNSDNSAFTITGSNDLTMAVTAAATVTGDKIDATAFTGKLNATGSNLADVIIGGSGADTLTGGKGADVLTGGAGADTFVFSGAAGATSSGGTVGNYDEIKDFVIGTDKLQFTGAVDVVSGQQTAVQNAVTALAATATAADIANAMAGANTTNLGVSFATFGGNTYVYFETTGATGTATVADDVFIKLTGITTLPTFANDVIA